MERVGAVAASFGRQLRRLKGRLVRLPNSVLVRFSAAGSTFLAERSMLRVIRSREMTWPSALQQFEADLTRHVAVAFFFSSLCELFVDSRGGVGQ